MYITSVEQRPGYFFTLLYIFILSFVFKNSGHQDYLSVKEAGTGAVSICSNK